MGIVQWLSENNANLRIFDIGRQFVELPAAQFTAIEEQHEPYPTPYLRQAWLAILQWQKAPAVGQNIWFVKLPLDEQNKLQLDARDAFIRFWHSEAAASKHAEAPFSFQPDANRMAYFHALASQCLAQPASAYYQQARIYLSGQLGWDAWQTIGLQGLAEVVARIDEEQNLALLCRSLPLVAAPVRNTLLGFMEHIAPAQELTSALNDCLAQVVAQGAQTEDLAAFARALSNSQNQEQKRLLLLSILRHPKCYELELLAALGSRCWRALEGELLLVYLECLARNTQGEPSFNALVADLLSLADMRSRVQQVLTRADCSAYLQQAFLRLAQSLGRA